MSTINNVDIKWIRRRDTDLESSDESVSIYGGEQNVRKRRSNSSRSRRQQLSWVFCPPCCIWIIRIICVFCFLGACLVAVSVFLTGSPNPLKLLEKPNDQVMYDLQTKWEADGDGLELIIENALDDDWAPYLEEYVAKWDGGIPDALNLTISQGDVDEECDPILGKMKVCNSNYGETGWEGINLVLLKDNYIRWSTCKMNDYYLEKGNPAQKKYAM